MSVNQILDVDVITDARAVGRWVIRAEDRDRRALPRRGLEADRNQMCFRLMHLAESPLAVTAGDVEVAQGREGEVITGGAPRARIVEDHLLGRQLRPAVRVDRQPRTRFLDRDLICDRFAVGSGGAGEDEASHLRRIGRFQKRRGRGGIVAVVGERALHGLADARERRKVHDQLDRALAQQLIDHRAIAAVGLDEMQVAHRRQDVDRAAVAAREIIDDRDGVPVGQQPQDAVRADVSRAAGDEDVHEG